MKKILLYNIKNINYTILVRLLSLTMDSVARCKALNFNQFNGRCGCTYCLHPGYKIPNSNLPLKYPVSMNTYSDRTLSSNLKAMKKAVNTNSKIDGIKGVSPFISFRHFDITKSVPVHCMQACLLGVTKQLLELWCGSENHLYPYYIGLP